METRANYALIGAFTLAVVVRRLRLRLLVLGTEPDGQAGHYKIVFTGRCRASRAASSVLFNGVKVGEVTHLAISEEDPSKVDVLVRIDKQNAGQDRHPRASRDAGLYRRSDVLLVGGTPGAPPLTAQVGQRYPQFRRSARKSKICSSMCRACRKRRPTSS